MIIYEVNITIPLELKKEYTQWLQSHINEMLKFSGFINSKTYYQINSRNREHFDLCVHYFIDNIKSLENFI